MSSTAQSKVGYLAIGTSTAPTYPLDVVGTIQVRGFKMTTGAGANKVLITDASGVASWQTVAAAREYQASISGISNVGWTNIAYIDGSGLNSKIKLTMGGTTGNVVVNLAADILVGHSGNIYVRSESGGYTQVTLLITSNGNEDFYIQAKTNSANAATLDCRVYAYGGEAVTMAPASISGATTLEHIAYLHQLSISGGGMSAVGLKVAGTIESSSGGFKFPNGSIQTVAAAGGYTSCTYGCVASDYDCPGGYTTIISSKGTSCSWPASIIWGFGYVGVTSLGFSCCGGTQTCYREVLTFSPGVNTGISTICCNGCSCPGIASTCYVCCI